MKKTYPKRTHYPYKVINSEEAIPICNQAVHTKRWTHDKENVDCQNCHKHIRKVKLNLTLYTSLRLLEDDIEISVGFDKKKKKWAGFIYRMDESPSGCKRPQMLVSSEPRYNTEKEAKDSMKKIIENNKVKHMGILQNPEDLEEFNDFFNLMKQAIKRKQNIYGNSWKSMDLTHLKKRLLNKVEEWNLTNNPDKLISISNLAMMIWIRQQSPYENPKLQS